jgi:hypothetical protein
MPRPGSGSTRTRAPLRWPTGRLPLDGRRRHLVGARRRPANVASGGQRHRHSPCQSQPQTIYAIYADLTGFFAGVYKSTNGGDTWTRTNDSALSGAYSSFGWWFGNIRVQPDNADRVYVLGLDAYRSTNGGASWSQTGSNMHVDHHALEFAPSNLSVIYEGNDGGLYVSANGGTSWSEIAGLAITQFYTRGGLSDAGAAAPGQRHQPHAHRREQRLGPDLRRRRLLCDRRPHRQPLCLRRVAVRSPRPLTNGGSSFTGATTGISAAIARTGRRRSYRSRQSDGALLRLAAGLPEQQSGRLLERDLRRSERRVGRQRGVVFGTITTLAVAPADPGVIYAGTDDANVCVTRGSGGN